MKKENLSYTITEDNHDDFAVIPNEQLVLIAQTADMIKSQLDILESLMANVGIQKYTYDRKVKTLADLKADAKGIVKG